jgi:hypothetical protein
MKPKPHESKDCTCAACEDWLYERILLLSSLGVSRIPTKKKFIVTLEVEMTDPGDYWRWWDARMFVERILEKTRPHIWSAQPITIEVVSARDIPKPKTGFLGLW